jgi:hypothetical protein
MPPESSVLIHFDLLHILRFDIFVRVTRARLYCLIYLLNNDSVAFLAAGPLDRAHADRRLVVKFEISAAFWYFSSTLMTTTGLFVWMVGLT